jgi:hypothetical protein
MLPSLKKKMNTFCCVFDRINIKLHVLWFAPNIKAHGVTESRYAGRYDSHYER